MYLYPFASLNGYMPIDVQCDKLRSAIVISCHIMRNIGSSFFQYYGMILLD